MTGAEVPQLRSWRGGAVRTITLIVTEACQLRCKYCYIAQKPHRRRMSLEMAKSAVDSILRDRAAFSEPAAIWEFMGGEPLLEIDLIDQISDYIKRRMYEEEHPWFERYRFSITTNGILYGKPALRRYIRKNRKHLGIGVSFDGSERKQDAQRVLPDGQGSYDMIVDNVRHWLEDFPDGVCRSTVAHDDLPFLAEGIAHLFDLGVRNVTADLVSEDVWHKGDDTLFEKQLILLADHMIEHGLYRDHICTFFGSHVGKPIDAAGSKGWCDLTKTVAIDVDGAMYPCIRFAPIANRSPVAIGHCATGIDQDKLEPFRRLTRQEQCPTACLDCAVASACSWCIASSCEQSQSAKPFRRSTYACRLQQARARANSYFFRRLAEEDRAALREELSVEPQNMRRQRSM